jgi:hypothetical protein
MTDLEPIERPAVEPFAWPPPTLPVNRSDSTPMQTTHAADHNQANQAINDIVAAVTAMNYELTGALATLRSWTPAIVSGGSGWQHTIRTAVWVDLGMVRVGYFEATAGITGLIGGVLVGSGFWAPGSSIAGVGLFFEENVGNRFMYAQPYDASTVCFLTDNSTSIFATGPSGNVRHLRSLLVAWEG